MGIDFDFPTEEVDFIFSKNEKGLNTSQSSFSSGSQALSCMPRDAIPLASLGLTKLVQ